MAKEFMTDYRRNTLISFLLQGGMAAEAQKTAEKYYGKDVDLNRFRRMDFHLLGAVQSASGQRFFQAKLEQRETPKKDGISFYREKVQYYHGRKEPQKILEVFEETIEHGRKTNAIELVVWGMTQKAHHAWSASPPDRQKALELARQAWEEVAGITLENSEQKFERIQARNDATMTYMNMCEKLLPSEMDKIFRREAKDGFYFYGRSYVMGQFRKNRSFSLSANDSVFKNINDPSFQKKHGFQSGLHEIRLMTVPVKTLIGKDFQACLEQAVSDFNDAKSELAKRNSSGESWPSFLARIHFCDKDADIKKALVAKCLHDEFQQKHFLITSLPVRSYDEGKRLLELAWKNYGLSAPERIQGLRHLMKTAPSATERQWCAEQLKKFNILP